MLKNVFEKKCGSSTALETPIFNRFADVWHEIKRDQFNSDLDDSIVCSTTNEKNATTNEKKSNSFAKINSKILKYVSIVKSY